MKKKMIITLVWALVLTGFTGCEAKETSVASIAQESEKTAVSVSETVAEEAESSNATEPVAEALETAASVESSLDQENAPEVSENDVTAEVIDYITEEEFAPYRDEFFKKMCTKYVTLYKVLGNAYVRSWYGDAIFFAAYGYEAVLKNEGYFYGAIYNPKLTENGIEYEYCDMFGSFQYDTLERLMDENLYDLDDVVIWSNMAED